MEISISILDYQESCKGNYASPQKQGVQRSLQGRMEEAEDLFHMLRLKCPYIRQRLFLAQQTARAHQGWLCSTHIHTHTCDLGLLFAQMWNSCMGRHRASTNTMLKSLSQYHPYSLYSHSGSQLKWECLLSCHLVSCFQRQHKFEFPQT